MNGTLPPGRARDCRARTRRAAVRLGAAGVAAIALVVAAGPPAAANGLGPVATNFRSVVTSSPDGVEAEVLAGDSYLAVAVAEGVELRVDGYDDEPYLHVEPDGTVRRNVRSPATYLNEERYGTRDLIEGLDEFAERGVDAAAEPEWEVVADGGVFGWHDHRIHWMSPETPPQVTDATQPTPMFDWSVPMTVDGEPTAIGGQLVWLPSDNAAPWLLALVVLSGAGAWVGVRRAPLATAAGGAAAAAVLGTALVAAEAPGRVSGMGLPATSLAVPLAVVGVVAAVAAPGRRRMVSLGAVAAALAGGLMAGLRLPVLWRPVMPGLLDAPLTRPVVVVVLAAALTGLVAAVAAYPAVHPRSGPHDPDPDDAEDEPIG